MTPEILLVNPPIYDFAAYDFWLKPYGLLSVAGRLRAKARFKLFDYLDRLHPFFAQYQLESDRWGRGPFYSRKIKRPKAFERIPRTFRRFGLPPAVFRQFLADTAPPDFVFIQTTMTYWYQGVEEVIEDIRNARPRAKIILGGNYVTLCPEHAKTLGADLIVSGTNLDPLWEYLSLAPDTNQPALWELYENIETGVIKLTDGCPFKCTYCSVPAVYSDFAPRPIERALAEYDLLTKIAVKNIAFYDDALLFEPEKALIPFLSHVLKKNEKTNLHTPKAQSVIPSAAEESTDPATPALHSPNALNARFLTAEIAQLMVRAGFKTFYLGFESRSAKWQKQTGAKVSSDELAQAVENLKAAGADPAEITAYQILGHPRTEAQQLEQSMHFVRSLGIRGTLADFSPIPGTPDGDYCARYVDMAEPLNHNKTAFPIRLLGFEESNRIKDIQRKLNSTLPPPDAS
ncbi:MAG: radical SAM protein [Sedimentisphaerales bacterium]|nr:radical SAM protein [Sedimentisphaerales bacterium]